MGACNFTAVACGKDVHDAYQQAVAQALWEHGHDSYNGTISTTNGALLKPITLSGRRTYTRKAIEAWERRAWDEAEKWGPCWALEIPRAVNRRFGLTAPPPRGQNVYLFAGCAAE